MTSAPIPAPRTVVEACFTSAGDAELSFVYDVAAALGIEAQPVRLAIRRIEAAGLANQHGRGRAGVLRRAPNAAPQDPVTAGQFRQARRLRTGEVPWDGHWRLTAFTLPDEKRADRDALRAALTRFGGVPIAPALYLSTADPRPPMRHYASLPDPAVIGQLIVGRVASLDIGGVDEPRDIVQRYWDLHPALEAYAQASLALDAADAATPPSDPVARAAAALRVSEAFARALAADPLLPPALLPVDWPPAQVQDRFLQVWEGFCAGADDRELYRLYRADLPPR